MNPTPPKPPVQLFFHGAMLDHRPEGWHPEHPEWLSEAQRQALQQTTTEGARWGHPERPERLSAIMASLESEPIAGVEMSWARPADLDALLRLHDGEYVARVESLRGKSAWLSPDTTAVSPGSVEAAHYAAGALARRDRRRPARRGAGGGVPR